MSFPNELVRLLEDIPEVARDLVGASRSTFLLLPPSEGQPEEMAWIPAGPGVRLLGTDKLASQVAVSGASMIVRDAAKDERLPDRLRRSGVGPPAEVLYVPVGVATGELAGVLELTDKRSGPFDDGDAAALERFGRYAALALGSLKLDAGRRRTIGELRHARASLADQVRRMEVLHRIETEINGSDGCAEVLPEVIRLCCEALDAEAGSILLLEGGDSRLFFGYTFGATSERVQELSIAATEGLAGWVLANGRSTACNDPESDSRVSCRISDSIQYRVRNLAAAPLAAGSRMLGVLEIVNRRPGGFDEQDMVFVDFIASQSAAALVRKLRSEEEREARRLAELGGVAARVVHDIRGPLSVLKLSTHTLLDPRASSQDRADCARLILSSIDWLLGMSQDVLDFSSGDSGRDLADTPVCEVFGPLLPLIERACSDRGVALDMELAPDLVIRGDAGRLGRVLMNLAKNAIEAMNGHGGRLSIRALQQEDQILIQVRDNGPGIPAEIAGRLFTPFATHGKRRGTGLGLAICKSIVESHGGRIAAVNAPDGGAVFDVTLPLQKPGCD